MGGFLSKMGFGIMACSAACCGLAVAMGVRDSGRATGTTAMLAGLGVAALILLYAYGIPGLGTKKKK